MGQVKLDRPLAFFDIEATGISPRADRIVELAIMRLLPGAARDSHVWRINPGIPIPAEVTAIHGISDADVADCPSFAALAPAVLAVLENADLAGYNILRYDIPMLVEEFARAGVAFDVDSRRVVDVQRIYHRREPRDLSAALAYYCNAEHVDAHGAEADVDATIRILEAQLDRYTDLPHDVEALSAYCDPRDPTWADRLGRLRWVDGELTINFGRKKGMPLRDLIANDPGFIKWMLRSDFPLDTRQIVENACAGTWPDPS
jgi:DNA polymerase III subunit epsilon